jgi:hypothetical protein
LGSRILVFPFEYPATSSPGGESIEIGCAADDFSAFSVTVTLRLKPNPEAFAAWRRQAHSVLRQAYDRRLQAWQDAQTVESFNGEEYASRLLGRNPAANREAERVEIQRSLIEIMRNRPLAWDFMIDPSASNEDQFPAIDFDRLKLESPEIRFLQQAFEWENLTYVLYPYFYGRPSSWSAKAIMTDVDPRWVEFLKAGAARAQLPVRPGFENAVEHYMMTGQPWLGRDEPTIGDDAYLSLYEEERARLGGNQPEAHLASEDFDIVVPTTLVRLRADGSLPQWSKEMGEWREVDPQ